MRLGQRHPHPLNRRPIGEPLVTGVRAIDGLLTAGKGQRLGIFAEIGRPINKTQTGYTKILCGI